MEPTASHPETSLLTTAPEILLLEAAGQGHTDEVCQLLDEERFRIESKDQHGRTALHLAILNGHTDLARCLVEEYNADINETTEDGSTSLHLAVQAASSELTELLISHGVEVDSADERNGATPLHTACELGNIQLTEVLLEHDADIDSRRYDGYTPLFIAVTSGKLELTECLLQHRADKSLRLDDGRSVEEAAGGNEAIIQLLKAERLFFKGPEIYNDEYKADYDLPFIQALPPPEGDKLQACHGFEATVIQFSIGDKERRSHWRASVYDLLYGQGNDFSVFSGLQGSQTDDEKTFTWYHLPANNMAWVETLITRLIEAKIPRTFMPDAKFKSNLNLSNPFRDYEQSQRPLSFFQRPLCKQVEHPDPKFAWGTATPEQIVTFFYDDYETMATTLGEARKQAKTARKTGQPTQLPAFRQPIARIPSPQQPSTASAASKSSSKPPKSSQSVSSSLDRTVDPGTTDKAKTSSPSPRTSAKEKTSPERVSANLSGAKDSNLSMGVSGRGPRQSERSMISASSSTHHGVNLVKSRTESQKEEAHGNRDAEPSGEKGPISEEMQQTTAVDLQETFDTPVDNVGISYVASGTEEPKKKARPSRHDYTLREFLTGRVSKKAKKKPPHPTTTGGEVVEPEHPHVNLIRGYAIPEDPGQLGLQPRRTLDQYFYSRLENTSHRDGDQVVYRYLEKYGTRPKIFMVDQLWLWVLNGDTIISCCPLRWQAWASRLQQFTAGDPIYLGRPPPTLKDNTRQQRNAAGSTALGIKQGSNMPKRIQKDPMNVHQKVLKHLRDPARKPIKSVYDLASILTNHCVNTFDEYSVPEDFHFFSFFEHSIGNVSENASQCLQTFRQNIHKAKAKRDAWRIIDMSVTVETDLLVEIEDIQDELDILRLVLSDQQNTIKQLSRTIDSITNQDGGSTSPRRFDSSGIENRLAHVELMRGMAQKTRDMLYHLIDLKQKQASSFEASAARDQAESAAKHAMFQRLQTEESSRQSKTLLVFTVVTIVFLPLSFMAAFFAIPLDVFSTDENQKLELGYVLKYMLSIAFASAIPFVWLAFKIDAISRTIKELREKNIMKNTSSIPPLAILGIAAFSIVVPVIIWTTKLAASIKVAVTVCMVLLVLTAIISIGLRRLMNIARAPLSVSSFDSGRDSNTDRTAGTQAGPLAAGK